MQSLSPLNSSLGYTGIEQTCQQLCKITYCGRNIWVSDCMRRDTLATHGEHRSVILC